MLNKALPAPEGNQSSEVNTDSEESQQSPKNDDETTADAITNPAEDDGNVEEPEAINLAEDDGPIEEPNETHANANVAQTSEPAVAGPTTGQQVLQNPAPRVAKPADDRLYTWAAFGLTVAIVVLLLKKILKANGYGAVFMNES